MAILANRVKTKNSLLELSRFLYLFIQKFSIIVLVFTCTYLLYFPTQAISKASLEFSGRILSVGSFISDIIIENTKLVYHRLSYFRNLENENMNLKLQLSEFYKTKLLADDLLSENRELRKLLQVTDGPKYNFISSRLLGVSTTPFASVGIIEVGKNYNVNVDSLVTNHYGLIGRVTNVSDNYSSVMLLNDPNSRIPVITASSKENGVLTKQDDNMQIIYLPENHNVRVGEPLYTSGDGKVYPYGLLVGTIEKINSNGVFVKLSANLNNIGFVRIQSK